MNLGSQMNQKVHHLFSRYSRSGLLADDEGVLFWNNTLVRASLAVGFLFLSLTVLFGYLFVARRAQDIIVLHYNAYFGVDIVGSPWQILLLSAGAGFFLLINGILANKLYGMHERVAAYILLFSSIFTSLSAFIALAALIFINS